MFRRLSTIVQDWQDSELDAFLQDAYWDRDKALSNGLYGDRLETHVYSYLKSLEIARHRYFMSDGVNRDVVMMDAVNSFYDLGYATGLSEHWRSNPNAMYKFASKILFATSFEEAHFVIGDYFAIGKDGKLYKHEFENSRRREKAA